MHKTVDLGEFGRVSGRADFVDRSASIAANMLAERDAWIARLRAEGYRAAHPNDGWVNRQRSRITFCYPQFNDGAGVGDLVMLGWPNDARSLRPIRLTGRVKAPLLDITGVETFTFEDATP